MWARRVWLSATRQDRVVGTGHCKRDAGAGVDQ
jgi:hypothetical protein